MPAAPARASGAPDAQLRRLPRPGPGVEAAEGVAPCRAKTRPPGGRLPLASATPLAHAPPSGETPASAPAAGLGTRPRRGPASTTSPGTRRRTSTGRARLRHRPLGRPLTRRTTAPKRSLTTSDRRAGARLFAGGRPWPRGHWLAPLSLAGPHPLRAIGSVEHEGACPCRAQPGRIWRRELTR